jgi:anti-sigma regulatory factor (Ser/Thr protein kinase)
VTSAAGVLTHDAMLYGTDDEFAGSVVPFLRAGLARGEVVAAVVTRSNIALLRDALGPDEPLVSFHDRAEWFTRPAAAIANADRLMAEAAGGGQPGIRMVGEVAFGPDRHPTWSRYESALNQVLGRSPAWLLCPYDTRVLAPQVLADAERTHPATMIDHERTPNARYLAAEQFLSSAPEPMPPVSGAPAIAIDVDEVAPARRALRAVLAERGWDGLDRYDDLVLAVSEVVANGIRHGAGRRQLRVWVHGGTATCEVTDEGAGVPDLLAGYRPPDRHQAGGRGLWIVGQLCDALAIERRGEATVVRFAMTF